jgi:hypothetical protein
MGQSCQQESIWFQMILSFLNNPVFYLKWEKKEGKIDRKKERKK